MVVVSALSTVAVVQSPVMGPTIPEQMEAVQGTLQGRPFTLMQITDLPFYSFDDLARHAEVIAIGQFANGKGWLTPDKRDIYTDYEFVPAQVVLDRLSGRSAKTPGQLAPMTVTLHGGEVIINGVTAKIVDGNLQPWTEGARLLLFLVRGHKRNSFSVYGSFAGMFEVDTTGRLRILISGGRVTKGLDGVQLDQVVKNIKARQVR
jgi:hypothetical protein